MKKLVRMWLAVNPKDSNRVSVAFPKKVQAYAWTENYYPDLCVVEVSYHVPKRKKVKK